MTIPSPDNGGPRLTNRSRPNLEAASLWRSIDTNHELDFNERVYPAHKVAALMDALTDSGVQANSLLAGSDLSEPQLRSASSRISYRQMTTVFRNAQRLSPDNAFALRAGQRMHAASYGMYGYALMSSPSREAALAFAIKYHPVMGPVAAMTQTFEDEDAVFVYDPILTIDPTDDLYRACIEFILASHLTLNKDLYGPSFGFTRIGVVYPEPENADAYRQLFGCLVDFECPRNEMRYESRWLREPVPRADPITNAQAHELCDLFFRGRAQTKSITAQIRRLLIDRPGWFPGVETMAAQLVMTSRMLHRRLEAEQSTYRKIVSELRMNLAIEYLRKTRMTNDEIAARLGYSDAANFRHAFNRWTGKSPSHYRT